MWDGRTPPRLVHFHTSSRALPRQGAEASWRKASHTLDVAGQPDAPRLPLINKFARHQFTFRNWRAALGWIRYDCPEASHKVSPHPTPVSLFLAARAQVAVTPLGQRFRSPLKNRDFWMLRSTIQKSRSEQISIASAEMFATHFHSSCDASLRDLLPSSA